MFRNFFDSPSTYFIYTNNLVEIEKLEKKIAYRSEDNWKLHDNWYRIYGGY